MLIYYYTPLCGTCQVSEKMLNVVIELLDVSLQKKIITQEEAEQWQIQSVPCLVIFQDGKLQEKIYAFQSVPYLLNKLSTYFPRNNDNMTN